MRSATLVITALMMGLGASAAFAQAKPPFEPFWVAFKAAVAKKDMGAIADMTRLPYNDGSKSYDRAEYLKLAPKLFNAKAQRCLAKAKPVAHQVGYAVFCGNDIFGFEIDGAAWKFAGIDTND